MTLDYVTQHRDRFLSELKAFLRIPSVSTQAKHKDDVLHAAQWLRDRLLDAGMKQAEVLETAGHPVVYAAWMVDEDAPTVLVYGHYDVQPPDPLDEWRTPPFEPTQVGEDLFARGASDDKGQLYAHVKALEAFHETAGAPPVNVKCIFEGEEEMGSPSLEPFIAAHRDLLAADVAVISDTHVLGKETPSIIYALRGLAYVEVTVTGPARDLHSGIYGGAVHNPINALCAMIADLQDEDGHITVPGFYDDVRELTPEEREELAKVPFDREAWLEEAGVPTDWGEPEYTIIERTTARPTLDVNGIWGGYIEPGAKTVLPSKVHAKISMRLVPDQDPQTITQLISEHLKAIAPPSVDVEVTSLHGGDGAIVDRESPAMQAAVDAYTATFGREPVFMREGGSIPVVAAFQKHLGLETILIGFGLPDDNLHAPNEKFNVSMFYKGIKTLIHFYENL
ncbi:MAG: dipeptidase [Anaerolineae bacterium]